jgi:ammonia channel protein AmtB
VDDVVNAVPCHAFCGIWGLVAAGLFTVPAHYRTVYPEEHAHRCAGVLYGGRGDQLAANSLSVFVFVGWTCCMCFPYYFFLSRHQVASLSTRAASPTHPVHRRNSCCEWSRTVRRPAWILSCTTRTLTVTGNWT